MTADFDVIVIGAGAAGENAAAIASRNGLRTAIVERELVGGECSYWACMPSKALLRPGAAIDDADRTPGVIDTTLDVDAALARRDFLASDWDDEAQVEWLESVDVALIRGRGRIAGPRIVETTHEDGTTSHHEASTAVVLATGTGAAVPPIEGLADIRSWDNREATSLQDVPRRLLILGGGAVGVEMAQAWKTLGSDEVTIVEREERLLSEEEPFVGDELAESFERIGIAVLTGAEMTSISRDPEDGSVHASVDTDDGTTELVADEILIAVGRSPRTDDVGLDTIGLEPGEFIDTDDRLRATGVEDGWLYAVGDVNGRSLFTHSGKYQGRIAGLAISGNTETRAWGDVDAAPRVVFTTPQIAAVGLTTAAAREAVHDVHTVDYDTGGTAGASTLGEGYEGTSRLVVDADTRTLLGATFVGPTTGEMLHAATVAIVGRVTLDALWHAIPAFPTVSEIWLRFLETYRDEHDVTFV